MEAAGIETVTPPLDAEQLTGIMLADMADGLDHPGMWPLFARFLEQLPDLAVVAATRLRSALTPEIETRLVIILAMCDAAMGHVEKALQALDPLMIRHGQSPLVQGARFYLHGLLDPENDRFRLQGRICTEPFRRLDVLERSAHLCHASWLPASLGDLNTADWREVWNSENARRIRASIHDGSYRYCNKISCPIIASGQLRPAEEWQAESSFWKNIVDDRVTWMPQGPDAVNLAYDRSCNLSCPSCRTEAFAADPEARAGYEAMQERNILPMLREARTVSLAGAGDPFASGSLRRLMERLGREDYAELRFSIMTNGMLFTPERWARLPALHGRVASLKISIDAASAPTHERLRRGSRWEVMLANLSFAGELRARGLVDDYELMFLVQAENFREMGEAVDLARRVGASAICFRRLANWRTFTDEQYRQRAIFLSAHPDHEAFLEAMQDERLRDPLVVLGDLGAFLRSGRPDA